MTNAVLSQETIDHGDEDGDSRGLLTKAKEHPILAGGALLASAGLAYVAVKAVQSAADNVAREVHVEASVLINQPLEELYTFWRDFRNLPRFMQNLVSIDVRDDNRSHWVAKAINSSTVEWDAEIFNEIPNQLIAWRSTEDADIVNAGSVRFEKAPGDRGTFVRVTMNYNPPGGTIGAGLAKLLRSDPGRMIKDDLRRFKQLMETGEIATIDGQSSGRAEAAAPVIAPEPFAAGTSTGETP